MKKTAYAVGLCVLAAAGSVVTGSLVTPAAAAVSPRTATNCTVVGTNYGGADPHYYGFKATCTDGPTNQWQLTLGCRNYADQTKTALGGIVTGSGTSFANCGGTNWEVDGYTIVNLS